MSHSVYINKIGCAVPRHDFHRKFVEFAPQLLGDDREKGLFRRMADRSQIEHRYAVLSPSAEKNEIDAEGFYRRGAFADTAQRMERYDRDAILLVSDALAGLGKNDFSHLIVASCTGFAAPGIDLQILAYLDLPSSVERTVVGFMGCAAGIPALRLARHIVRSDRHARVLVVAVELCSLHFQESVHLDQVLSFLLFADGCAAAVVSGEPTGLEMIDFGSAVLPGTSDYITWRVGDSGFELHLSGQVPSAIRHHLPSALPALLSGIERQHVTLWAVHPGGRTILDAIEGGLGIPTDALASSRRILRDYGNMSSATVLFVLREMMDRGDVGQGCAMAFGPGVAAESMTFSAGQ
jgi:predicted naringenin-chalcone synthase